MPKKYIQTAGGSAPGKPHLHPPTRCDSCTTLIEEVFYDAATRTGTWGNFCPTCAELFQIRLGPGQGQQYTLQEIPDEPMPHPFSLGAALEAKALYRDNYLIDLEAARHRGDTEEETRLIDLLAALADGDHLQ